MQLNLSHLVTPRCYDHEEKCLWTATWQFIVKRRKIVSSQTCYKSLSVSSNHSTFYQCSATAFLSVSRHHFSSVPPQGRPLFFHFTYISVCSCFNGFERNCNLFPYILLYFVRVCADKLCYQYCLLYFKLFRYYHNFLHKKVTLCISVKSLTPGISRKEFSIAILLLQVDRRWQKNPLGKSGQTC